MAKRDFLSNLIWQLAERCGAQGVTFVVTIILARILEPEMYGTVALVTVITTILTVFVDSGLGTALIQKIDSDELDYSTAFWFNCATSVILYGLLFLFAPLVSIYYERDLTDLVRVLALSLMIYGVKNIQQAYVVKKMIFKKFFFATLSGTIFAAIVGIWMAYSGYGVWAIAVQGIANSLIDTVILWCITGWKPKFMFSFNRLKGLLSYGWKMFASDLINRTCSQLQALVIGKKYSTSDLGYYNKGNSFPFLFISNINYSIDRVLFPTLSKRQNDPDAVKEYVRKGMKVSSYIIVPCMVALAVMAEPIVRLLLTEKWLPCVPFLRIFCFLYALWPIYTINLNAIKSMGRSDLFLRLEIIKNVISVVAVLITMRISVMAMAYSIFITASLSLIINAWPNKKLINYSCFNQLKDIFSNVLLALIMGACMYPLTFIAISDIMIILIQFITGVSVYMIFSAIFKVEAFKFLLEYIKRS